MGQRRGGHDPGRVICDLAVMLADGGDCLADLRAVLGRHSSDRSAEAKLSEDDVRDVREVRARLLEVFKAPDDRSTVTALNVLLEPPHHVLRLRDDARGTHWIWSAGSQPDTSLAERLQAITAVSLLGVIKTLGADRFRACASPDCSGLFARHDRRRAPQVLPADHLRQLTTDAWMSSTIQSNMSRMTTHRRDRPTRHAVFGASVRRQGPQTRPRGP